MRRHRRRWIFGLLIGGIAAILVIGAVLVAFAPRPPGRLAVMYNPRGRPSDIYTLDADGGTHSFPLTNSEEEDTYPVWSPDGRHLAFTSSQEYTTLYIIDADGSHLTALTSGMDAGSPAWSPDGQRIAFAADHRWIATPQGQRAEESSIYLIDVDGSHLTKVTTEGTDAPSWSPDGQRLAFVSNQAHESAIYTINVDGSGITQLIGGGASGPLWSPDGQHIAFFRDNNGTLEVDVMRPDGAGVTPLLAGVDEMVWSPDGAKLALQRSGIDNQDVLWVINANGSAPQVVVSHMALGETPTWSPDRQWIAFTATPSSLILTAGEWPKLAYATVCMWLRLGCTPAYVQFQEVAVYAVRADGSNLMLVSQLPGASRAPAWKP